MGIDSPTGGFPMFGNVFNELGGRGLSAVIGLFLGGLIALFFAHWRRRCERHSIEKGDARDTVVIEHHLIERTTETLPDGSKLVKPGVMRIRAVGQSELCRVVPNGHLARGLLHRAFQVTPRHTLISMEGA